MPLGTAYPFGMREIVLTPFTNENTEAAGTPVALPAARTLSWTDSETFTTLRGNDADIATRGSGPTGAWELEGGGYSADVIKTIFGGTLADSGTTPNQIRTWHRTKGDSRPYFKAEGRAISDSGGDVHVVLYRCRATNNFEGEFADGQWFLTGASGQMFPSLAVATTDKIYSILHNETADPII